MGRKTKKKQSAVEERPREWTDGVGGRGAGIGQHTRERKKHTNKLPKRKQTHICRIVVVRNVCTMR